MVTDRGLEVLRVIVEDYVATREPVGSKSIVDRHGFGVSAATIRNDMAVLEDEGLIAAPHTSSGRIPTDKGYRAFVDQLSALRPLSPAQRHAIESFMGQAADLDDVLARTVRLLSQLTNQLAVVQYPQQGRIVVAGAGNLVRTEPDFHGSIAPVLDAIEEQVTLLRLFSEMEADAHGVAVSIGREHDGTGLEEASVVAGSYDASEDGPRIGVLGPTRMDYSANIATVRAVARYLSKLLGEQG